MMASGPVAAVPPPVPRYHVIAPAGQRERTRRAVQPTGAAPVSVAPRS